MLLMACLGGAAQTAGRATPGKPEKSPAGPPVVGRWVAPGYEKQAGEVDALFRSFVGPRQPGGVVIVARDGQILFREAYGLADAQQDRPLQTDAIFHLASAGKQFTGLALLMLAEEGRLRLDDPVDRHLPELARFGQAVTLRRMLHHTSGLPDYYETDRLYEQLFAFAAEPNNGDALQLLAERGRMRFEPGEKFFYSNAAYDLLGSVVERVSGQPLGVFLAQRIFDPLGMTGTFSMPSPRREQEARLPHSYSGGSSRQDIYDEDPLDRMVGSGSVYTTVDDMARYDAALYTERLVKQSSLTQAYQSGKLNDGSATGYGFGWELGEVDGLPTLGHGGAWLGFISSYWRCPQQRLAVIVLLNRDYGLPDEELGAEIGRLYLDH